VSRKRARDPADDPDAAAYEAAAQNLVRRLQLMRSALAVDDSKRGGAGLTKKRKELNSIAAELVDLADALERAWDDLEEVHDRALPSGGATFKGSLWHMRHLAESARTAANELPSSRQRRDVTYAAEAFVYLRRHYGFARPSRYDESEDVAQLRNILIKAGIPLSPERVRNLIAQALARLDLDPHLHPEHLRELLQQGRAN
jgi:hypothetical protein